jgi:hypothetical protein
MDEELKQGRRRWRDSKSSTNRLRALVAAFPQSSDPAVDKKITADVEARFTQHLLRGFRWSPKLSERLQMRLGATRPQVAV